MSAAKVVIGRMQYEDGYFTIEIKLGRKLLALAWCSGNDDCWMTTEPPEDVDPASLAGMAAAKLADREWPDSKQIRSELRASARIAVENARRSELRASARIAVENARRQFRPLVAHRTSYDLGRGRRLSRAAGVTTEHAR